MLSLGWIAILVFKIDRLLYEGVAKERKALNIEGKTLFGMEAIRGKYYEYMLYTYVPFLCVLLYTHLIELNVYMISECGVE